MPRGPKLKPEKKAEVVAMAQAGLSPKDIAAQTGLSIPSIWRIKNEGPPLDPELLDNVKERLRGRFLVASDTLLESALRDAEQESPYRRMIMAGIAHDHYLRTLMLERGKNSTGVLTQILVMVDASQRGAISPFTDIPAQLKEVTVEQES
jgi:hypothetical protein